jgi:DNA-binding NtrC family response regulator
MRITLDIDITAGGLGNWLSRALVGLHPSTNAACELHDALAAISREIPARSVSDEAARQALAEHGSIKAAAKHLGIARSTLRARLVRLTLEARARDAEAANDTAATRRTG